MKRLPLLLLCLVLCLGLVPTLFAKETPPNWWPQVAEILKFRAESDDRNYRLEVTLFQPEPVLEKLPKPGSDGDIRYEYKGNLLPRTFMRGQTVLTGFKLFHKDKEIPIDPKFWQDLTGFRIQESKVDSTRIPEKWQGKYFDFLGELMQPRIYSWETDETLLIEWNRVEEGGGQSTIRWIIDRSGKTLRHCVMPVEGC